MCINQNDNVAEPSDSVRVVAKLGVLSLHTHLCPAECDLRMPEERQVTVSKPTCNLLRPCVTCNSPVAVWSPRDWAHCMHGCMVGLNRDWLGVDVLWVGGQLMSSHDLIIRVNANQEVNWRHDRHGHALYVCACSPRLLKGAVE